jgi:hypothetical protein
MYHPNFLEKRSVLGSFYKARMVMFQLELITLEVQELV